MPEQYKIDPDYLNHTENEIDDYYRLLDDEIGLMLKVLHKNGLTDHHVETPIDAGGYYLLGITRNTHGRIRCSYDAEGVNVFLTHALIEMVRQLSKTVFING